MSVFHCDVICVMDFAEEFYTWLLARSFCLCLQLYVQGWLTKRLNRYYTWLIAISGPALSPELESTSVRRSVPWCFLSFGIFSSP